MPSAPPIRVFDAVKALAFIGDLSMGQPIDHSLRTAWLADQLALAAGYNAADRDSVKEAALLRWSGCTANAHGFAELLGDDIAGREAMLAMRPDWASATATHGGPAVAISPLAQIHCEVSGEVARLLDLGSSTERCLRRIFETYDGNGMPSRLSGELVPAPVFAVSLAGDLEIFTRIYGLEHALVLIGSRADTHYPRALVQHLCVHAAEWLVALEAQEREQLEASLQTPGMSSSTSPELLADVIDLKLPWLTGYSRAVAELAAACGEQLGMDAAAQASIYMAGLIHGIGRAAVPNYIWNTSTKLLASAWEKIRLVPYWTSRAAKQIGALAHEAEIASLVYERANGSGYFRGTPGHAVPLKGQVLAVAAAWVALRSDRPWRRALSVPAATAALEKDAEIGRFDPSLVQAVIAAAQHPQAAPRRRVATVSLSARETEVLRHISLGASNKDVARSLGLSPSTVGTHVESIFRKLECSTRAAATLKASAMGLLQAASSPVVEASAKAIAGRKRRRP